MQNKNLNFKMENNDFKKVLIKNRTCYYFNDTVKLEDFDIDNILIDSKSYEKILIYDISLETLIDIRFKWVLDSIKQMDLLEFIMEIDI